MANEMLQSPTGGVTIFQFLQLVTEQFDFFFIIIIIFLNQRFYLRDERDGRCLEIDWWYLVAGLTEGNFVSPVKLAASEPVASSHYNSHLGIRRRFTVSSCSKALTNLTCDYCPQLSQAWERASLIGCRKPE